MISIPLQLQHDYRLKATSQEDLTKLKDFKVNQILKAKLTGIKKPRSVTQLNTYWAACTLVADNSADKSKEQVDFDVKILLRHIKSMRTVGNETFLEVDSISFKNLSHLEACGYFDRAFPVLAGMIGVTEDQLMAAIKADI